MTDTKHAEHVRMLRDVLVARAVKAQKIAPDQAEPYKRMFDASPRAMTNLLTASVEDGGLMPGLMAHAHPPVATEYPREWFHRDDRPTGAVAFEDQGTVVEGAGSAWPSEAVRGTRDEGTRPVPLPVRPPLTPGGTVTIEP